jgi:hypothetical protein
MPHHRKCKRNPGKEFPLFGGLYYNEKYTGG